MNAIETKHTPGPWKVNGKVKTTVETCADGQGINIIADCSDVDGIRSRAEDQANAALIAQAPALLAERDRIAAINAELMAALELALASAVPLDSRIASAMAGDDVIEKWADWVMKARAALAKANKPHQSNDKEC